MLASRGFVYKTERAAIAGTHPNCHCYSVVRFSTEEPELPERNAYYQRMWEKHGGTMKAWRKWIAKQRVQRGGKI